MDFIPVIPSKRRKRSKRKQQEHVYNVQQMTTDSERYHLGEIHIGKTNNLMKTHWGEANIVLKTHEEDDLMLLEYDNEHIVVRITTDTPLLANIFSANIFSMQFRQAEDDLYLNLYIKQLPIAKYTTKLCNIIKDVFYLLFGVADNENRYEKGTSQRLPETIDCLEEIYDTIRLKQPISNEIQLKCDRLKPKLRPYQAQGVNWMLKQEKNAGKWQEAHPEYTPVTLPSNLIIYYNKHTGKIELEQPLCSYTSRGGILADEMGLGKTIEILACILSESDALQVDKDDREDVVVIKQKLRHVWPEIENARIQDAPSTKTSTQVTKRFAKRQKTELRLRLEEHYQNELRSVLSVRNKREISVHCICGCDNAHNEVIIDCLGCGKRQHTLCMGYQPSKYPKTLDEGYNCPQCWQKRPLLDSKATLIVCPQSLRTQWLKEIRKHVKYGCKVLDYSGSMHHTPVYPLELIEYDLVLSTFNVLHDELRFVQAKEKVLRKQSKYGQPGAPLTLIRWHRLCFDEAQIVEIANGSSGSGLVAEMAQQLEAKYRWAVTGTPISMNIGDLYGLIEFLQVEPYNERLTFANCLHQPYIAGRREAMLTFLARHLWRTQKKDVLDQINIPQQLLNEYHVEFSPVERYFYEREHALSRSDFMAKLKNYDLQAPLASLKTNELRRVLGPLLALRQACAHHNAVKGRYLITRKPCNSMHELLDALIARNLGECEENLRKVVSAINGLAGIYQLLNNANQAANEYRKVLQFASDFESGERTGIKLNVDFLLQIHATHNLADILDLYEHVGRKISESTLRDECTALEQRYLRKFSAKTVHVINETAQLTDEINDLESQLCMQPAEWYAAILETIFVNKLDSELSGKVQSLISSNYMHVNDHFTHSQVLYIDELKRWELEINTLREESMQLLNGLYDLDGNNVILSPELVKNASECHLRITTKQKTKKKCALCKCNELLKRYERKLYVSDEKNVESWKPSHETAVMRLLVKMARVKRMEKKWIDEGELFLLIYDTTSKEFKSLRKIWTYIDAEICAFDEIDICKIRLQLKSPESMNLQPETPNEGNRALKNLSYIIENKYEAIHQLSEHELDFHRLSIDNEGKAAYKALEKCVGTHKYLNSLYKQQISGEQPDPCPICKNALETQWNILMCGHCYCIDCMQMLLGRSISKFITCSVCREKQKIDDINFVAIKTWKNDENDAKIKGNCSTKIEAIVKLILKLKQEEEDVKILVFSNWHIVLSVIKDIFTLNDISSIILTNQAFDKKIEAFKTKQVNALLMPVKLGSKGLNLIEATHIIFVEPILDPADELQAIGRVHRIGQKRTTYVHKFLISDSIEANMHLAAKRDAKEWDRNRVTLAQIKDLFIANNENDNGGSGSVDDSGGVVEEEEALTTCE